MNIFILDDNPRACAEYHLDKHVVKMPLETAQLIVQRTGLLIFSGTYPKLSTAMKPKNYGNTLASTTFFRTSL